MELFDGNFLILFKFFVYYFCILDSRKAMPWKQSDTNGAATVYIKNQNGISGRE